MFGDKIQNLRQFLADVRDWQRVSLAVTRGTAGMQSRDLNWQRPSTWEFSGFSQNGEDGLLDVLTRRISHPNRYVVEIGCADGIENNSAWLIVVRSHGGLLVEGNPRLAARAKRVLQAFSTSVDVRQLFVSRESAARLFELARYADPDVFSLDIDGVDYHVAEALFDAGFRPKIFVVEYNSVYGPKRALTVPYDPQFVMSKAHPTQLYYGVSVSAWRRFFTKRGYRFVTVDRNGVNALFVDPTHFDTGWLDSIEGLAFAENQLQWRKFSMPSEGQFAFIENQPFVEVPPGPPG